MNYGTIKNSCSCGRVRDRLANVVVPEANIFVDMVLGLAYVLDGSFIILPLSLRQPQRTQRPYVQRLRYQ